MSIQDEGGRGATYAEATPIDLTDKDEPADEQNLAIEEEDQTDADQNKDEQESDALDWGDGLEVPERLKGKTAAEVLNEFSSMHSEFGRQARELGEARQLMRDFVQDQLAAKQTTETKIEPVTLEKLEENPQAVIDAAVKAALKPVLEQQSQVGDQVALAQFEARHPDYLNVVSSPEFNAWIKASPYRTKMYNAANHHDYDAASDLLNGFAEVQKAKPSTTTQARENASLRGAGTTPKAKKGKIYKAIDIQREFNEDRDKYNSNQAEYAKAFEEGRVE